MRTPMLYCSCTKPTKGVLTMNSILHILNYFDSINKFSFNIATFNSLLNHFDSEQSFPSSISYDLNDKNLIYHLTKLHFTLKKPILFSMIKFCHLLRKNWRNFINLDLQRKLWFPMLNGPPTFSKIKNYENFEQINQ